MLDLSRSSTVTRLSIALALSGGVALVSAGGASALGLPPAPAPIATVVATVTAPLTASAPAAPTVLPLNVVVTVPIVGSIPVPASPLPPIAAKPAPAPLTSALIQVSTGVKSALNQVGAGLAATPLAPVNVSGAPAALANVVVQAAPLATLCVQATGTGTALLNIDLIVLRNDLGTPLIQTFPGFLAPCPAGTVPIQGTGSTTPGSTIVGVDTNLGSLVGACVRITTSVVPVQSTILVLTQNLITQLEAAGLPLEQLVVPCPTDGDGGFGDGGFGGGGDPGGNGGGGGGGNGTGGTGSGHHSQAASAIPELGSLPFTGAEIGLLLALAAAMIAAGTAMVRKARAAQWATIS